MLVSKHVQVGRWQPGTMGRRIAACCRDSPGGVQSFHPLLPVCKGLQQQRQFARAGGCNNQDRAARHRPPPSTRQILLSRKVKRGSASRLISDSFCTQHTPALPGRRSFLATCGDAAIASISVVGSRRQAVSTALSTLIISAPHSIQTQNDTRLELSAFTSLLLVRPLPGGCYTEIPHQVSGELLPPVHSLGLRNGRCPVPLLP